MFALHYRQRLPVQTAKPVWLCYKHMGQSPANELAVGHP